MSFDADEEILQDFLVEAGEILEQLSEQLVDLENRIDDKDLLNAIFRGFHTVKGGAGFLQLNPLVELCHVAENVFDCLRNSKLSVNSELMDVVLQALDNVNAMFSQVSQRVEPIPAEQSLLDSLQAFVDIANGKVPAPVANSAPSPESSPSENSVSANGTGEAATQTGGQDFSDGEFAQLVDALHEDPAPATSANSTSDDDDLFGFGSSDSGKKSNEDEITEDEFDALLDELHGKGHGPCSTADQPSTTDSSAASGAGDSKKLDSILQSDREDISDDEFEVLLDALHGKGKHQGVPESESKSPTPSSAPTSASSGQQPVDNGDMTDNEFENLLDELHGQGKGPTADSSARPAAAAGWQSPAASNQVPAGSVSSTVSSSANANSEVASASTANTPQSVNNSSNKVASSSTENSNVTPINAAADKGAQSSRPAAKPAAAPPAKDNSAMTETTVRVDTKRLDDIMNMVGELVLVRNRLVRLGLKSADEAMAKAVANLDVVTADLQSSVMKTRMQPIKKVFGRFPRVVRDLARNLKKEITLELQGEETDLDKNLVEALADPLVHLVRNSVDHGIEKPDVRESKGKARAGKVVLAAQQEGDHIVLSITDDGGGMDADLLRRKAVEKGLMDEESAERISDHDAFNLIFHPGFSTKDEISDVSGRGVGMDVVKTKITQLNGTIDVESQKNIGTVIAIKVPLTLAIMPTLMVMLGEQTFALPLVSVNEIFHMDLSKTNVVDGQEVVIVREKALPLFHLKRWLVSGGDGLSSAAHVVVVSVGTQKVGFVVDQLIGQEEVVIKPLGKMLHGTAGMAGATITGDGRIALILDVPSMLRRYAGRL